MNDTFSLPYRPCAGVMLVNRDNQVFVGQRLDSELEAWQMPQGGVDPGEDPLEAAYRELWEETGVARELVEFVAESPSELQYDLPSELVGRIWKGKWRGQRQRWYLFRFLGTDNDVNIETAEPEFRAWRWVAPQELPELIVPFKKQLYRDILAIFDDKLS